MGNAVASMATYKGGGAVKGPGTGTSDSIPVRLSKGEFVVPADSVKAIGLTTLHALVASTHKHVTPKGKAPTRRMANGGLVSDIANGIRSLVMRGGTGSANPQNNEARQAAGLTTTSAPAPVAAPAPAPAKPVDPNNPAGIKFANGGLVGDEDQPSPYGQQMAKVGGAITSALGTVGKTIFGAPGYGLNALTGASQPSSPAAVAMAAPAGAPAAPVVPAASFNPGADSRASETTPPTAIPTLNNASGVTVAGAPGVSKLVQNGKTLYSNVTGPDNDTLMSNKPGLQTAPTMGTTGQPGSAIASLAAPADNNGLTVLPDTGGYGLLDKSVLTARNARVGLDSMPGGGAVTFAGGGQGARLASAERIAAAGNATSRANTQDTTATQLATSQIGAASHIGASQIGAAASRYGADTGAQTAIQKLAQDAPHVQAQTAELGAQAKLRQGTAAAQQALLNAKTPEERQAAEDNLRAVLGRDRNYPELYSPIRTGTDPTTLQPIFSVLDKRTGEVKQTADSGTAAAMPASKDKLVSGTVYQTARGPAKWNGSQFIPQ